MTYGDDYKGYGLLGCDTVLFGISVTTFWENLVPKYYVWKKYGGDGIKAQIPCNQLENIVIHST
jgi:hypothetical protein